MKISDILTAMDRKVYEEELQNRLPQKIFDAHVHLWERSDFPDDIQFKDKSFLQFSDGEFSLTQYETILRELLPGKEVYFNAFSMPNKAISLEHAPACRFNMSLVSPFDPVDVLEERMERNGSIGVKPYIYFSGKSPEETQVEDMITPEQLAMLEKRSGIITFHIPRKRRFEDPLNQRQMVRLCEEYPHIDFIFAHIGRAYYMENIRKSNLSQLAAYPNCYFDTAMLNHTDVFRYTLDHFPAERVLFGTDTPIALLHGKSVEINNDYLYLCAEDCHVGSMAYIPGKRQTFTLFFYEQLRALLESVPEHLVNKIFFENAWNLFTAKEKKK